MLLLKRRKEKEEREGRDAKKERECRGIDWLWVESVFVYCQESVCVSVLCFPHHVSFPVCFSFLCVLRQL